MEASACESASRDGQRALVDLLQAARRGDAAAFGELLQAHRNYLKLLAEAQLRGNLQSRLGGSDVVQEAFLAAHRGFDGFRGQTEHEFRAWLRKILVYHLGHVIEQHAVAEKRNVHREVSLQQIQDDLGRSAMRLESMLAACGPTPSGEVQRRENALRLADHLESLPPDYREVLLLRHLEGLSFAEVAQRMGRSSGAVRMVWFRALESLRGAMASRGAP